MTGLSTAHYRGDTNSRGGLAPNERGKHLEKRGGKLPAKQSSPKKKTTNCEGGESLLFRQKKGGVEEKKLKKEGRTEGRAPRPSGKRRHPGHGGLGKSQGKVLKKAGRSTAMTCAKGPLLERALEKTLI